MSGDLPVPQTGNRARPADLPLISVGMPVLNNEKTLALAIRSILWQSYPHWELIIADDGSADRTLDVARHFADDRIRILADGEHRGLPVRLNEAVRGSRGQYFARMDGDDISYPERFEHQLRFLESHPGVDLLAAGILVFKAQGQSMGTRSIRLSHQEICRRPEAGFYLPHPTWMGKTAWFRRNPYSPRAVRMEDQELLLRTHRYSNFASLPEVLLGYREDSFSLRKALRGRYNLLKLVARERALCRNSHLQIAGAVLEHGFKALVEIAAVSSGLTYKILRHRAQPADSASLDRWQEVWSKLTSDSRQPIDMRPLLPARSLGLK